MITRRNLVLGGLALAAGPMLADMAFAGEFDPQPNAGFDKWKAKFRGRAVAKGLPAKLVDASLASAQFLPGVIAKDRGQLEFSLSFEDYLAIAVSDDRVAAGRAALAARRSLLRFVPASLISSHAHAQHHRRSSVSFSDGFGSPGLCDTLFGTRWDRR